jgi:hypothetical protein
MTARIGADCHRNTQPARLGKMLDRVVLLGQLARGDHQSGDEAVQMRLADHGLDLGEVVGHAAMAQFVSGRQAAMHYGSDLLLQRHLGQKVV